ncbi:MAG: hypothetical protein JO057_03100 [Chloroflexi bacterium]|nr:hypothetical protein [Chloroflexota bacterium]
MPDQPSFRLDPATGKPSFKFIKYLLPVDRPDGSKGGGFLIFDSVFVIPPDKLAAIQKQLDQQLNAGGGPSSAHATISLPEFTKGTAKLTLLDSGGALVSKIESAGAPSLLGSLICSFTAELTPEGAAVVEAAMKGSGGVVQIEYDLSYWAVLPPITGKVWFNAVKFASFYQSIQKSGGSWDSSDNTENETMREAFINSDSGGVEFDFTGLDPSDANASKTRSDLTNWGWQQLNVAVQNVLGSASGGSSSSGSSSSGSSSSGSSSGGGSSGSGSTGGVTGTNTGADLGSNRGDDGMKNVTRDESSFARFSFYEQYRERDNILLETAQQGTLQNIPDFADYAVTVNANDPFFAQVHSSVSVNADFAKFRVQSVDVNLIYDQSNPPTTGGFHFIKPDDIYKFDSDTVNGDLSYKYSVNVNYMDQSAPYKVPPQSTTAQVLTVDVGSMGMLYMNMTVTNVDFTRSPTVLVSVKYPDPDASGAAISRQFSFDSTKKTDSLVVVLMKPFDKPYQYQVTYAMADGTQLVRPWISDSTQELFIQSPFSQETVSFISEGDFTNDIDNIFLKMTYVDAANNYQQASDFTFTSANRSHDWSIPILVDSQGVVNYSGVVTHKDHTTEDIPQTTSTSNLITFGPPNQKIITVTPDPTLLDFTKVKVVQVNFAYNDPANRIALNQEVVIKSGATPAPWTFYAKDPSKTSYTYQATYFMATTPPTVVKQPETASSDTDLLLQMPSQ